MRAEVNSIGIDAHTIAGQDYSRRRGTQQHDDRIIPAHQYYHGLRNQSPISRRRRRAGGGSNASWKKKIGNMCMILVIQVLPIWSGLSSSSSYRLQLEEGISDHIYIHKLSIAIPCMETSCRLEAPFPSLFLYISDFTLYLVLSGGKARTCRRTGRGISLKGVLFLIIPKWNMMSLSGGPTLLMEGTTEQLTRI